MSTRTVDNPKVVSREEWLVARKNLLARERQLTRERDAIAAERRQLPWVKVEKNYVFDSPNGKKTLADLFNGKSQLIVYHLMFGPEWQEACRSCSFNMDHTDPTLVHLAQRDVSFAAVSRAPISKIEALQEANGLEVQLAFVPRSRNGSAWNQRLLQSNYLDYVPKGRDEEGLRFTMSWLRHHDRYESGKLADANMPYWPVEAVRQDHLAGLPRVATDQPASANEA